MPGLATELRELIEGRTKSKRRHREIIKWMQKKRLLRRWMRCQKCKHKMKFKESVCVDNYAALQSKRAVTAFFGENELLCFL
jgi:uncharacterized membrane protein YkvA (DUF1232 family)